MKDKTGYAKFAFVDGVEIVKYKGIVVVGKTLYTLRQWHTTEEDAIKYAEAVHARLMGGENIQTMEVGDQNGSVFASE